LADYNPRTNRQTEAAHDNACRSMHAYRLKDGMYGQRAA
jgi:hypothetical protein